MASNLRNVAIVQSLFLLAYGSGFVKCSKVNLTLAFSFNQKILVGYYVLQ